MVPSGDQLFKDADLIFQQDLAPAHTAKSTRPEPHRAGLLKVRTPESGVNSIRTRLHLIFQAHSDLRAVCVAHTHTHGRMNQCCSDYRLFCKTKHIATSDILDKP